jgi:hypothetical protein
VIDRCASLRTRIAFVIAALFLCAQLILGSHIHTDGDDTGALHDPCAICLVKSSGNDEGAPAPALFAVASPVFETIRYAQSVIDCGLVGGLNFQEWARGPPAMAL